MTRRGSSPTSPGRRVAGCRLMVVRAVRRTGPPPPRRLLGTNGEGPPQTSRKGGWNSVDATEENKATVLTVLSLVFHEHLGNTTGVDGVTESIVRDPDLAARTIHAGRHAHRPAAGQLPRRLLRCLRDRKPQHRQRVILQPMTSVTHRTLEVYNARCRLIYSSAAGGCVDDASTLVSGKMRDSTRARSPRCRRSRQSSLRAHDQPTVQRLLSRIGTCRRRRVALRRFLS